MSTCYYPAHSLLPAWDRSVFIRLLRDALDALPIGAQAGAGLSGGTGLCGGVGKPEWATGAPPC